MAVRNSNLWLPEVFLCAFGNKIHKQQVTYILYINIQFMVVSYIYILQLTMNRVMGSLEFKSMLFEMQIYSYFYVPSETNFTNSK